MIKTSKKQQADQFMKDNKLKEPAIHKIKQKDLLLNNLEAVILDIIEGLGYRELAAKYNVHQEVISWLINESEHCARAKNAVNLASYNMIRFSYDQLVSIKDDDTHAAVRRKTELANHFRYLAMVKNPKIFNLNYKDPATIEAGTIIPQLILKNVDTVKENSKKQKKNS